MSGWEKILETSLSHRAAMIRGLLEDNNIPVVVLNKQDSSYLFGYYEIYVPAAYFIQGLIVLEQAN